MSRVSGPHSSIIAAAIRESFSGRRSSSCQIFGIKDWKSKTLWICWGFNLRLSLRILWFGVGPRFLRVVPMRLRNKSSTSCSSSSIYSGLSGNGLSWAGCDTDISCRLSTSCSLSILEILKCCAFSSISWSLLSMSAWPRKRFAAYRISLFRIYSSLVILCSMSLSLTDRMFYR